MTNLSRTLLLAALFAGIPVHAAGLPDTGQDACYNETEAESAAPSDAASVSNDAGTHPRQDCRYGRDAAAKAGVMAKTGAGIKGFDYTKIANNSTTLDAGTALGSAPADWACTKDNITGLTWEVKTLGSTDLRFAGHTYTWHSTDSGSNGGSIGNTGSNTCNSTVARSLCNTQAYTAAVNNAALCSYIDWRMPTPRELLTLIVADGTVPGVDLFYFPHPPAASYWSATPYTRAAAPGQLSVWLVDFLDGYVDSDDTSRFNHVRLVRGVRF
jgi:hypothetical protein